MLNQVELFKISSIENFKTNNFMLKKILVKLKFFTHKLLNIKNGLTYKLI